MQNRLASSAILVLLFAGPVAGEKKKKSRDEKQNDRMEEITRKLAKRRALLNPSAESLFLHKQAESLILLARTARDDHHRFDRLTRAANDLLESSEKIFHARESNLVEDREEVRNDAARSLQKNYFRLQQGEYFARLAQDSSAPDYIRISKTLYQQARAAYDKRLYDKAEDLGSAAARIVSALENLAQARQQAPDPPRLD